MWNKTRMHELLDESDKAVVRALLTIYDFQTEDEKASHTTSKDNNVGFSAFDAEFCSDLAEKVKRGWTLSAKQMAVLRNKMKRYHRQLCLIANENERKKAAVESVAHDATERFRDPDEEEIVW